MKIKIFVVSALFLLTNCSENTGQPTNPATAQPLQTGAERLELYLPKLKGKRVAVVVNQTSRVGDEHLVDVLLQHKVKLVRVFAPEHGFRGEADAGATIEDGRDRGTGLPILSLYGSKKRPEAEDLADLDLLIFDIQDIGARFYTYISTMHYVMDAAAEYELEVLVLDRPNPNGHYIDGPVLDLEFRSFVGMHPIPVVHGMTVGELAQMINGEGWLPEGRTCDLTVISCSGYTHSTPYALPVRPSPNLPNMRAVYLYPSLCLLEGTILNVGRGTDNQFQVYGAPLWKGAPYFYQPVSKPGAKYPKHEQEICYGYDLTGLDPSDLFEEKQLNLTYILEAHRSYPDQDGFFLDNNFIDKLAGTDALRHQIASGMKASEIRQSWEPELQNFKNLRSRYLLYP